MVEPVAPLPVSEDLPIYLVKPRLGLSTPKVFGALDLAGLSPTGPEELLAAFQERGVDHGLWVNDLEPPAFKVCPELGELRGFLAKAFRAVLMSGSGTTVCCIGEPEGGAEALEAQLRERFDIEGVWRTRLLRRPSAEEWYSDPLA